MLRADSTAPLRTWQAGGHVRGWWAAGRDRPDGAFRRHVLCSRRKMGRLRGTLPCARSGALATRLAPLPPLTVLCPLLPPRQLSLSESSSGRKTRVASVRPPPCSSHGSSGLTLPLLDHCPSLLPSLLASSLPPWWPQKCLCSLRTVPDSPLLTTLPRHTRALDQSLETAWWVDLGCGHTLQKEQYPHRDPGW